jgi:hypothetical protein
MLLDPGSLAGSHPDAPWSWRVDERGVVANRHPALDTGEMLPEEERRRELSAGAGASLLEDRLEVIIHGVGGDAEPLCRLGRRRATQRELGYLLLARGEPLGLEQQRSDQGRVGTLDKDGNLA